MRSQSLRAAIGLASVAALLATGSAAGRLHTVKAGDTLEGISRKYGVPVPALAQANGIADPDHILTGARLAVPAPGTPALPTRQVETKPVAKVTAPVPPAPAAKPGPAGPAKASKPVVVPASRAGLRPLFVRYAKAAAVPADLAMALAWQESGWQTQRVSSTRAVGVMQLMPDTVEFVSRILLRQRANLDPRDPAQNIRMGTRFLRYLLDRNGGNLDAALASYYQGLRSVHERGVFPETQRFVANVKALWARF